MTKELIPELTAIALGLEDQLEFYRQIGIPDVGGAAPIELSATVRITPAVPTSETAEEPPAAPAIPVIPRSDIESRADLRARQDGSAVQQTGLFGDAAVAGVPARKRSPSLVVLDVKDESLQDVRNDIGECTRCKLHTSRKNIVFGEGSPTAKLMFVGEGPGADEDVTGRPFVGRAGQLLDKIIAAIGLERHEVYIANVVKCRPPGNRTPERDEVETCEPFLFRQIALIRPRVVVALGSPAFQCLLKTREPITRARGHWRDWNGLKLMPTFHPAYLLRSPDKKREAWEDMKKVRDYLMNLET